MDAPFIFLTSLLSSLFLSYHFPFDLDKIVPSHRGKTASSSGVFLLRLHVGCAQGVSGV